MRRALDEAVLHEGVDGLPDDQMIEDSDVNQRKRLLEAPCNELIRRTRLRESRRMIVIEDDGSGVMPESRLHDFAGMNGSAADRPAEEILHGNQTMPAVEMQHAKDLILAGGQMHPKEFPSERRRCQHGGTDPVPLGEKGLRPIEDVGRLSFPKAGLVSNVESRHDGGP